MTSFSLSLSRSAFVLEVDKARSMMRNYVLLAFAALASIGLVVLSTVYYRNNVLGDEALPLTEFDAVGLANSQLVNFGGMLLALLGIMLVSYDFRGSVLQGTALAVPDRSKTYAGKLAVAAAVSAVFAIALVGVSFVLTQSLLGDVHSVGLADEGVARSLVGAVIYLVAITVFAAGLTTALGSGALAIGILMPLMFMISSILRSIPIDLVSTIAQLLPDQAGARMATASERRDALLGPVTGGLVLLVWVSVAVGVGAIVSERRDVAGS